LKDPVVIDMHTHFIPPEFCDAASHPEWEATVEHREGAQWVVHRQGFTYPLHREFLGGEVKFEDMRRRRIDLSVLSLSPTLFYYWISTQDGVTFARMANDSLAKAVAESGGRLAGLATLPLRDPVAAAEELRRAVEELGFVGAQIGTTIEGDFIDGDRFTPLWEAADALHVPVILHPYYVGVRPGYEDFYLTNIFVNPLDTALAAARIIFSGLLDRFEALRLVLVHAGGFLPYQIGRMDHGWRVREEARARIQRPPSEYLKRFYFDTITHSDAALSWLIEFVDDEHVLLGTDLSFDMADFDPVGRLERVVPTRRSRHRIAQSNAASLFGIEPLAQDVSRHA
jgi:aminocarboxymuconate-semialdehyde decarboxylase